MKKSDEYQEQNAIPVSIHSKEQHAFHLSYISGGTWLGMTGWSENTNTWPFDNTPLDYTAFAKNYPKYNKPYFIISKKADGLWKESDDEGENNCFCQKAAVPGSPTPPPYPDLPINEQCEPNWLWLPGRIKMDFFSSNIHFVDNFFRRMAQK